MVWQIRGAKGVPSARQSAKLGAMKFIAVALLALSFPIVAVAAPAKAPVAKAPVVRAPVAKAQVSIAPEARALWKRAVALYHNTDKLQFAWRRPQDATASFHFDRAGFLFLHAVDFDETVVIDGLNKWTLDESKTYLGNAPVYTRENVSGDGRAYAASIVALRRAFGVGPEIGALLDGGDQESPNLIESSARNPNLIGYRATVLPAQPYGGQACDLLRITLTKSDNQAAGGRMTQQKTYWFARSDARLLRFQNRFSTKEERPLDTDYQITEQTFNPKFAPDTFKSTPPKGAVLSKD